MSEENDQQPKSRRCADGKMRGIGRPKTPTVPCLTKGCTGKRPKPVVETLVVPKATAYGPAAQRLSLARLYRFDGGPPGRGDS